MKQKYRSNPYSGAVGEMILSTYKYEPKFMAITHVETEKFHKMSKAYHKVNKVKNIGQRFC